MQNNPINGDANIVNPNLPSNIDADQEDKKVNAKEGTHSEETKPEDFEAFDVDKVKDLEETKDPSQKDD
ncbi:hypothetical protein ACFP65_12160 [Marinilactibacillus sp. GCM10026970]|uniref:hypothetical protein n=1 Tax=Marinilactibacillus sp. GCM10026970 TaxID=3252642 RepID=UPI0036063342